MADMELYLGDCLEVMPKLADKSVDAIICDLPYGVTSCAWDSVIPFEPLWTQYKRIIRPRGAIVLFGSQPFTSALVMSNLEWFKYCWTWDKGTGKGHLVAKYRPLQQTEDILIFGNGAINYYPQTTKRDKSEKLREGSRTEIMGGRYNEKYSRITDFRYPKTLLNFVWSPTTSLHPTQKPVALLQYLIKTYTNPGDTVLDNCFGSGTTGVACKLLHRRFVGVEKDAHYFDIAAKRIAETQAPAITDEGVFLQPEQAPLFEVA